METNVFEDLGITVEDSSSAVDLKALGNLVDELVERDGDISRLSADLKILTDRKKELEEKLIPEMMQQANLKGLTHSDGRRVEISTDLYTSLPKVRAKEIFAKMRELEAGDLIKNVLTVTIERGQDNMVAEVEAAAEKLGFEYERAENIAPQTYKKFLSDRVKAGKTTDLPFFGAHQVTKAKLTAK